VTELLTAKASIESSKWLVRNGRISYAVDRDVRALENRLNIVIQSKINANPVDRLTVSKDIVERATVLSNRLGRIVLNGNPHIKVDHEILSNNIS
jgi:hypothetical protein